MALNRIIPEHIQRVSRIVHFYDLQCTRHPEFPDGAEQTPWMSTIRRIRRMADELDPDRYLRSFDRRFFIQDITVRPEAHEILGKIRSVNTEIFPEIQNLRTDERREIEALADEGVVETSHFIIRYDGRLRVGLEYNHNGAKISDLCNYLQVVGRNNEFLSTVKFVPLINDNLAGMMQSINRISEMVLKVHRNNVNVLREIDEGVFTAMEVAARQFENEYVTMSWKIDYRHLPATPEASNFLTRLFNAFNRNPNLMEMFETVDVRAENAEMNNRLHDFDFLLDKVKAKVEVEKRPKHRTIVSEHMFSRIRESIRTLNI